MACRCPGGVFTLDVPSAAQVFYSAASSSKSANEAGRCVWWTRSARAVSLTGLHEPLRPDAARASYSSAARRRVLMVVRGKWSSPWRATRVLGRRRLLFFDLPRRIAFRMWAPKSVRSSRPPPADVLAALHAPTSVFTAVQWRDTRRRLDSRPAGVHRTAASFHRRLAHVDNHNRPRSFAGHVPFPANRSTSSARGRARAAFRRGKLSARTTPQALKIPSVSSPILLTIAESWRCYIR